MPTRRTNGVLLLISLAALGVALVWLASTIVNMHRAARELGAVWGSLYIGIVGLGLALLVGVTGWTSWRLWRNSLRKKLRRQRRQRNPSQMSAAERDAEVRENLQSVDQLRHDPSVGPQMRDELRPLIHWIEEKHESQRLEIVAFGTISSGKSSLLNALAGREVFATELRGGTTVQRNEVPWTTMDRVVLVDTPGLAEVDGSLREHVAAKAARDADLVLVVVDGPLRNSEFELLQRLAEMEKRVVICLNKQDWYNDRDRDALLTQIRGQVGRFVRPEDVLAVRSRPTQRRRVRILPDGTEVEEQVDVPSDIQQLAERMMQIVRRDGRDLLMANLLLQSRGLVDEAKQRVREALDERAWEIVDRHMWGAAGAAALSPFPVVDLAAGCAISTKMVLDLARVYHQDIDVEVAVNLLGQQGKTLLGVLGSAVATPVVASGVASLIKSVPGVGTVAGGLLQGVVQALIARWIGAIFITYFKDEQRAPPGGLAEIARREWERVTSVDEIRRLVQATRRRFHEAVQDEPEPVRK